MVMAMSVVIARIVRGDRRAPALDAGRCQPAGAYAGHYADTPAPCPAAHCWLPALPLT